MINAFEVECCLCAEKIGLHTAKLLDDFELETDMSEVRYYCPACVIEAKNAAMHASMVRSLKDSAKARCSAPE